MYVETDPCPKCGRAALDRVVVDVGVGNIYGPWQCTECGWQDGEPEECSESDADA